MSENSGTGKPTSCIRKHLLELSLIFVVFSTFGAVYFVAVSRANRPLENPPVPRRNHLKIFAEVVEPEERDAFQDFRTSYMPAEEAVPVRPARRKKRNVAETPSKCVRENTPLPARSKRTGAPSKSVSPEGDAEEGSPILRSDPGPTTNSKIYAFWKGQGDRNTIRTTQASIMKQYIDSSADPCVDFFQYACGSWAKLNPIPADKAGYDTFEMLRENLDVVLKDLLDFKEDKPLFSEYLGPHPTLPKTILQERIIEDNLSQAKYSNIVDDKTLQVLNDTHESPRRPSRSLSKPELWDNRQKYITSRNGKTPIPPKQTKEFERMIQEFSEKDSFVEEKHFREMDKQKRRRKREIVIVDDVDRYKADGIQASNDEDPSNEDATLKARFLFRSCINYEILKKRGNQPLLDLLDLLGGWPILNPAWEPIKFDWQDLIAKLRLYNNDIMISEWVGPDIRNSDEYVIQFDQTTLGLPTRDYYLQDTNKEYVAAYKEYIIKTVLLLGGDPNTVEQKVTELIEFETRLAKITSSPEDRRNVSELYRRMSISDLEKTVPDIKWRRYLSTVMNRSVAASEPVVIFAMKYVQNLVVLVKDTDAATLANYLLWRFVRHRINNLDDRFQEAKQKFYNILFGRERAPPRWKNCIAQVNSNMGMALGAMFVRKHFDETSKNDTLAMTRDIQKSFRELLHLTDWIDDETKTLAENKVEAMTLRIGYPDFILDKKELDERYADVKIHPDTYFENILNILQHLTKMEQARLGQTVNKTAWNTAPAVVNAYYSRNKNQIMFPAGILQPPFYHRHFPKSLNYGGIGVVIGHEITHGFDDKGRLFDRDGNLHRWWAEAAVDAFRGRAQCLVEQYAEYVVPDVGVRLDGVNTQGENIADNGGVKQAFRAYKRWLEENKDSAETETMPGLDYTPTQLFFLNFAQVWCGSMRPEAMRSKLKTAVHSPGAYRVVGALSNSADFAREFSCPPGSPMHPRAKCSVW